MLHAVFLDLDNTMVLFDERSYFRQYFAKITPEFSDLFTPGEFEERYLRAALSLKGNTGAVSNRDFFLENFCNGDACQGKAIWRRFMTFYGDGHSRIRVDASVPDGLNGVLDALRRSGLKLVIASNPVFPAAAQKGRLAWGDIDPGQFDFFTEIENMTFVKPRIGYYRQICQKIGEPPEACLMVGNDLQNDMVAKRAGLKTYLTREVARFDATSLSLTDDERNQLPEIPTPDFAGPFAGVTRAVEKLMGE